MTLHDWFGTLLTPPQWLVVWIVGGIIIVILLGAVLRTEVDTAFYSGLLGLPLVWGIIWLGLWFIDALVWLWTLEPPNA